MKKVVVFFIFAMLVFGACSAKRADAQSTNNAQRIIGTWTTQDGETWVFNANGTGTVTDKYNNSREYKFTVIDTKLAMTVQSYTKIGDILISSDGKTLFIFYGSDGSWLTKK